MKVSNKKIFITGGAGYAGSRYVPLLLESNNFVTVYDNFYFGDFIPNHKNLKKIKSDIRDISFLEKSCEDHEIFIHLACISNDTSFELDEKLSTEINFECFEKIVIASKKSKIKRFIYASTSSVYGISNQKDIKEEHPFKPLTLYNKLLFLVGSETVVVTLTDRINDILIQLPLVVEAEVEIFWIVDETLHVVFGVKFDGGAMEFKIPTTEPAPVPVTLNPLVSNEKNRGLAWI